MTQLYTGTAYQGQNNLSVQGCFHAMVTHGGAGAKTLAAEALKILAQHKSQSINAEQAHTQAQALLDQVNSLDPSDQSMASWALTAVRQL